MRHLGVIGAIIGMSLSVQAIARELIIEPRLGFVGGKVEYEGSGFSGSSDLSSKLNFGVQVLLPLDENLSPRFGLALGTIGAPPADNKQYALVHRTGFQ
ncbi:MAG: hypothetical protein ACOH5I_15750 [Oligoflexus sp.]